MSNPKIFELSEYQDFDEKSWLRISIGVLISLLFIIGVIKLSFFIPPSYATMFTIVGTLAGFGCAHFGMKQISFNKPIKLNLSAEKAEVITFKGSREFANSNLNQLRGKVRLKFIDSTGERWNLPRMYTMYGDFTIQYQLHINGGKLQIAKYNHKDSLLFPNAPDFIGFD